MPRCRVLGPLSCSGRTTTIGHGQGRLRLRILVAFQIAGICCPFGACFPYPHNQPCPTVRLPEKPGAFTSAGHHAGVAGSELPWRVLGSCGFPFGSRWRGFACCRSSIRETGCACPLHYEHRRVHEARRLWASVRQAKSHVAPTRSESSSHCSLLSRSFPPRLLVVHGPDFAEVSVFTTGPFWLATDLAIRLGSEPFLRPSWSSKSVTDRRSSR